MLSSLAYHITSCFGTVFFYFYVSAYPPDLHSFPTRRSSDLSSGRKNCSTTSLSSRAEVRSWPKGFSMTTRRQEPSRGVFSPELASCPQTFGKASGGIER